MDPEYWQKLKTILDDVMELPPERREEFLVSACGGDAALRQEVDSMLAFEDSDLGGLDDPGFSFSYPDENVPPASPFIGKTIGNYRVLESLGSGGMGVVFLAERADDAFDQKVALKLIKRGMDSDAVLRRFLNERRILASLKHRNIARLLDGGTTEDGLPYFVMEYIEGRSIVEYVQATNLNIEEKLNLFLSVCSAVSVAHQNLVIHRDLKPSNILVTMEGSPKLLDFGIAKVLSGGERLVTATQQFVFTPDYASPEQVRGEQLTTASDIYSLGVILYEVMTGTRPYNIAGASFGEIHRIVGEINPAKPSAVGSTHEKSLRGDLDNIILKSLRKEPERRYSSVEQLSSDIRNYLDGRPVSASRDSWGYRSGKFIRRHVYAASATALIALSLIGGMGATLYQAQIARRERAMSEKRFTEIRQLTSSIMFEMNDKIRESPIKARELLVTKALEYLERLSAEGENDPAILSELATAYEKVGEVQAGVFDPSLGRPSDALASHRRALEIRERLFAEGGRSARAGMPVIKSRLSVGEIYMMSGELAEGRKYYESAVALGEELGAGEPDNLDVKTTTAGAHALLGQAILRSGSISDALAQYERALQLFKEASEADPTDIQAKRSVGVLYSYIGYVKLEQLDFTEASRYFAMELQLGQQMLASDPGNMQFLGDVNEGHYWLSVSLTGEGKIEESLTHINASLADNESRFEADTANLGVRNGLADSYMEKGKALARGRRFDESLAAYSTAIGHYEAVSKPDPNNLSSKRQIVMTRRLMADSLAQKGETGKALAIYNQALRDFEDLIRSDPDNTEWQDDLAICHLRTGESLAKRDRLKALEHFRTALAAFERLSAASPENARIRRDLDTTRANLEQYLR